MTPAALETFAALHPRYDAERRLLVLELEHGKANEVGSEQLAAFEALCAALEGDAQVSCLCTSSRRRSSKGTALFIAGANVTERRGWDDAKVKAHVRRQRELMRRLRHLPVFTVALSGGMTLGWGVEFLLTADYVLATDEAAFALPETGLGILPGARGTAELARLVGPAQAMRLGASGERIRADEAFAIGLVQERVADVDAGLSRVHSLAERLARNSPTAIAAFKAALLAGQGRVEAERLELEARAYELCVDSGEAAIGRGAFDEIRAGRSPAWGPRREFDAESSS